MQIGDLSHECKTGNCEAYFIEVGIGLSLRFMCQQTKWKYKSSVVYDCVFQVGDSKWWQCDIVNFHLRLRSQLPAQQRQGILSSPYISVIRFMVCWT